MPNPKQGFALAWCTTMPWRDFDTWRRQYNCTDGSYHGAADEVADQLTFWRKALKDERVDIPVGYVMLAHTDVCRPVSGETAINLTILPSRAQKAWLYKADHVAERITDRGTAWYHDLTVAATALHQIIREQARPWRLWQIVDTLDETAFNLRIDRDVIAAAETMNKVHLELGCWCGADHSGSIDP